MGVLRIGREATGIQQTEEPCPSKTSGSGLMEVHGPFQAGRVEDQNRLKPDLAKKSLCTQETQNGMIIGLIMQSITMFAKLMLLQLPRYF